MRYDDPNVDGANLWSDDCSAIARRKLGASKDFRVFYFRAIGTGDLLVKGAVPRVLTRGPRAGHLSWTGCRPILECVITRQELVARERARARSACR